MFALIIKSLKFYLDWMVRTLIEQLFTALSILTNSSAIISQAMLFNVQWLEYCDFSVRPCDWLTITAWIMQIWYCNKENNSWNMGAVQYFIPSGYPSKRRFYKGVVCNENLPHSQHLHYHGLVLETDHDDDTRSCPAGKVSREVTHSDPENA